MKRLSNTRGLKEHAKERSLARGTGGGRRAGRAVEGRRAAPLMPKFRRLGGVEFFCVRPGLWVSVDRRYAIVEMMEGHPDHQWALFRTARHADPEVQPYNIADPRIASADFWSGDEVALAITMGELALEVAVEVATEVLTEEQIQRVRRALIGMPRKTAGDRALIRDCDAVLEGAIAPREAVARVWLAMSSPAGHRKGVRL